MKSCLLLTLVMLLGNGCASARRTSAGVFPFELIKNQIVVAATVNGVGPFSFLVDTGVTPSVIDQSAAAAAGIIVDTSRSSEAAGAGSAVVKVYPTSIPRLKINGEDFGTLEALAVDLSKLARSLGRPLHGILGDNFLRDKVVTIDYALQQLTISPQLRRLARGGVELPFTTAADDIIPIIEDFAINGKKIPVSLDTGSSLGIELYPQAVERLGLQELKASAERASIVGARGEADVRKTKIDSARIGGVTVSDVPITFSERSDHGPERLGNIGNSLLQNFLVTFDFKNKRVRFEPR